MDALGPILIVLAAVVVAWVVLAGLIWLHRPSRDLALPALRALPDIAPRWIGRGTGRARLAESWPGDAAGFSAVARMLRLPAA